MNTLKEVLKERGISMKHVALSNGMSAQSLNRYKDRPAQIVSDSSRSVYIFDDIGDKHIYSSTGNPLPNAQYILVRTLKI